MANMFKLFSLLLFSYIVSFTQARLLGTERSLNHVVIKEGEVESFRPTTPGHSPGFGHSLSPNANVASPNLLKRANVIPNGDVEAFRPTKPGNSPGIGHSLKNDAPVLMTEMPKANVRSRPTKIKRHSIVITEGNIESFRPTTPGHSPGMGHSLSQDREIMAKINGGSPGELKKRDHFVISEEENVKAFSPTSPGHSPGIGHSKHD